MDLQTLPLFPLNMVVFPTEILHLHIFEPRYQQLTRECEAEGLTFGMPPFLDNRMMPFGTELRLVEVINRYENGRMDIRCEGLRTFELHEFSKTLGKKLYAGGTVQFYETLDDSTLSDRILLAEKAQQLFALMETPRHIDAEEIFLAYQLGHELGLSSQQEYQLLTLPSERRRIEFLIDHLTRTIPVVEEVERAKRRVRMNGHFKHFDPLNF